MIISKKLLDKYDMYYCDRYSPPEQNVMYDVIVLQSHKWYVPDKRLRFLRECVDKRDGYFWYQQTDEYLDARQAVHRFFESKQEAL